MTTAHALPVRTHFKMPAGLSWALLCAGCVLVAFLVWRSLTAPSYGPPVVSDMTLTLAPGVRAEVLPSHRSLAGARFDDFDVSPSGAIAVVSEGSLFDLAGGDALLAEGPLVHSVAFAGDTLAIAGAGGRLGYLDGDRFAGGGRSPVRSPHLVASSGRSRLLIFAASPASGAEDTAALAEIAQGEPVSILSGSAEPILAAAGDDLKTFFSVGDCLFAMMLGGPPRLVFRTPRPDTQVVGLAVAGETIYFSTERAVYVLEGGLAFPLAAGIGGTIRLHDGAIYVLDASTRRLFRILRDPNAAPSPAAPSTTRAAPSTTVDEAQEDSALDRTLAAVNLREGPTTQSTALRELPEGTRVRVLGEARAGWLEVEAEGERGYVHMSRLGRCDPVRGDLDCRWLSRTCVDRRCR